MSSKFSGLIQAKQQNLPQATVEDKEPPAPHKPTKAEQPTSTKVTKPGRPRAKRSDPNFCQVTAYIRLKTYNKIKMHLLGGKDQRDFSELVEDLLSNFLTTQKSS